MAGELLVAIKATPQPEGGFKVEVHFDEMQPLETLRLLRIATDYVLGRPDGGARKVVTDGLPLVGQKLRT